MKENIYNPEYVKNLFNKMSNSYERMNFITSFGFSIRWRKQFLSHFPKSDKKIEIIDLLTGMGETWNSVKKRFPNSNLTALDFSSEMIKKAESKNKSQFKGNINLILEDVLINNLPEKHFDVVICSFGLKTFNKEQLELLAKVVKRILKMMVNFHLWKFLNLKIVC